MVPREENSHSHAQQQQRERMTMMTTVQSQAWSLFLLSSLLAFLACFSVFYWSMDAWHKLIDAFSSMLSLHSWGLTNHIWEPQFVELLQRFLYEQVNPNAEVSSANISLQECPSFVGTISIFHSVVAHFYVPSDLCGAGGMYHEHIHWNSTAGQR